MRLIKEAVQKKTLIGVVCQKEMNTEDPGFDDLYTTGVIADIVRVLEMPDGTTTVILQGKKRFSLDALEEKLAGFLRLSKAVEQSENTLKTMSEEISRLQQTEDGVSEEIEKQQRIQWELEQKLEQLAAKKNEAEHLKHVLAENKHIQEELDAVDLAQDTMTNLSTTIRDSFGLYLNKTASELIEGITGGIYRSMSIDQDLNIFMNTPTRLVPIEQVSSGTMDQIYLAVRLAAAKLVIGDKGNMPLIFDDSFALYDDDRLKTALKWLSKAWDKQCIIFTCHQREEEILKEEGITHQMIQI